MEGKITTSSLQISLKALESCRLPEYKGSAIRGGFGLAFRRVACPFPKRDCRECLLRQTCVWSYVFDTPRPTDSKIMRRYETVPHPFVIEPPDDDRTQLAEGDELNFGLTLIGRAIRHLPYFIYAFEQMADQGLGTGRARFAVRGIYQNSTLIYDPKKATIVLPPEHRHLHLSAADEPVHRVTLRFLTPTRIIYQGRMARRPQFHVIIRSLLRRIGLLAYFHDQALEIDYQAMIARAEGIRLVDCTLAGYEWRRFSGRQQRILEVEGMTGTATYEGELARFLPFLRAGEILHIGKGTAFGMGRFRLEVE